MACEIIVCMLCIIKDPCGVCDHVTVMLAWLYVLSHPQLHTRVRQSIGFYWNCGLVK